MCWYLSYWCLCSYAMSDLPRKRRGVSPLASPGNPPPLIQLAQILSGRTKEGGWAQILSGPGGFRPRPGGVRKVFPPLSQILSGEGPSYSRDGEDLRTQILSSPEGLQPPAYAGGVGTAFVQPKHRRVRLPPPSRLCPTQILSGACGLPHTKQNPDTRVGVWGRKEPPRPAQIHSGSEAPAPPFT